MNTLLRILLLIWIVSYLFISCAPILNGNLVLGTITLLGGIALFIPWLIGIALLGFGIWLSDPRRRR